MQKKIRVGAVSYLNTKPLIYGFEKGLMKDQIDLIIDYPSKIASMLLKNEIDVGLVPVAIIPKMKEHFIISDYCIGCEGAVASVCLFSEVPLEEVKTILLDYQSKSSVALLKILLKDHWKKEVNFEQTINGYQSKISGTTAGLVIGDRALQQRKISKYIYDLGSEWKIFTGLPFVFAAWISNKRLGQDFEFSFNEANAFGLQELDTVIKHYNYLIYDLKEYYTNNISYNLNKKKLEGLKMFLEAIRMKQPSL